MSLSSPRMLAILNAFLVGSGVLLGFHPSGPSHAFPLFGCEPPERGSRVARPFGFDPGLAHRCLASAKPGLENYYEDLSDCEGLPGGAWTVANHSGPSCEIGPDGQKFPINDGASPIRLKWMREPAAAGPGGWALDMVTDLEQREHPCWRSPEGSFTWLTLQNNSAQTGVPLPRPDQLEQVVHVFYQERNARRESHTRMGVSAQVFWDGVAHLVEIDLYTSPFWADAHPDPDVIVSRPLRPNQSNSGRYLLLAGRAMSPTALGVAPEQGREVRVRWHAIFGDLIRRGLLPAPLAQGRGADGWESTASGDVAVYTEVYKRNASALDGAVAALTVRDFRVESRPPERGGYIANVATCDAALGRIVVTGSGLERGSLLQLFNRYHIPVGAPIEPIRRRGNRALLFELDAAALRQRPTFLRITEPGSGRASNFARTPY